MLKGLFTSKVGIQHCLNDTRDSNNEYQYNPPIEVKCAVKTPFRKMLKLPNEEYINVDKLIIVDADEEVLETDRFILNGDMFIISGGAIGEKGLVELQDVLGTGKIEGYQVGLVKERKYNEHETAISKVTGRRELQQG